MTEPTKVEEIVDIKLENLKDNQEPTEETKPKHGGAREGAGRPEGSLSPVKLEQLKVKEAFNQRVMKHADDLFNAQYQLAKGEQVLMVKVTERGSKGAVSRVYHEQVTDMSTIKEFLDDNSGSPTNMGNDDEWYYLSTRSANNQAIDSLLNRAMGKAPDKLEITGGFFSENELTIKVVGERDDVIDIGEDGQIADAAEPGESGGTEEETGTDPEQEAESSNETTEPSSDS